MTIEEAREAIGMLEHQQRILKRFIRIKSAGREFYDVIPDDVLKTVSVVTGLDRGKIRSKDRHPEVVSARNITMYILRNYLRQTTSHSARYVNRDHSTCIHACKQIEDAAWNYEKYGLDQYETVRHLKECKLILGIHDN